MRPGGAGTYRRRPTPHWGEGGVSKPLNILEVIAEELPGAIAMALVSSLRHELWRTDVIMRDGTTGVVHAWEGSRNHVGVVFGADFVVSDYSVLSFLECIGDLFDEAGVAETKRLAVLPKRFFRKFRLRDVVTRGGDRFVGGWMVRVTREVGAPFSFVQGLERVEIDESWE